MEPCDKYLILNGVKSTGISGVIPVWFATHCFIPTPEYKLKMAARQPKRVGFSCMGAVL